MEEAFINSAEHEAAPAPAAPTLQASLPTEVETTSSHAIQQFMAKEAGNLVRSRKGWTFRSAADRVNEKYATLCHLWHLRVPCPRPPIPG